MSKPKHPSLFIRNHPTAPQLCPELAKEIGLNESILLLQWEYWMRAEAEERDGELWLRKTEREVQQFFPFWGTGSIHRILQSLVSKGYMVAGSFDTGPGRGAQWLRFDWDKVRTLKSIRVDCSNLEQRLLQKEPKLLQSGATVLNINKDKDIYTANADRSPSSGYKQPKRTKTLLPQDFTITAGMRNWARGIGLTDERIENAHERYVRHVSKVEKKLFPEHWPADWEEWMLNDLNFNGNGRKQTGTEPSEHPTWMASPKPENYFNEMYADFKTE